MTKPTGYLVPDNRTTNSFGNDNSHLHGLGRGDGISRFGVQMHDDRAAGFAYTLTDSTVETGRRPQAMVTREHLTLPWQGQADRLARPLRRRAPKMARPARVRMRRRKPCFLARRRLFGW
jgi:hypothetical protein